MYINVDKVNIRVTNCFYNLYYNFEFNYINNGYYYSGKKIINEEDSVFAYLETNTSYFLPILIHHKELNVIYKEIGSTKLHVSILRKIN